jgi:Glycosyl hydrolases family 16
MIRGVLAAAAIATAAIDAASATTAEPYTDTDIQYLMTTTTTIMTAPPEGNCRDTAAARFGWPQPNRGDSFDVKPAAPNWHVYDGPGHAGNGRRTPNAVSASNGIMTITADARGNSAGMSWASNQYRGRWEVCMRTAPGSGQYHPVMLLWHQSGTPYSEVDFTEILDPARQRVNFFVHYGSRQTSGNINIDATQWHSWAVEWTATEIVGYVDGNEWFRDSNVNHLPEVPMSLCLQLDNFGGDISAGGRMDFDWARQYPL